MFSEKIFSGFYVIELEGDAANLNWLLGKDFNSKKVTIGSYDFPTDIEAACAAKKALDYLLHVLQVPKNTEKTEEFNPEFLPGFSEEELVDPEDVEALNALYTRKFDSLGDFVVTRTTVQTDTLKITAKAAVNPKEYILEKTNQKTAARAEDITSHREATRQHHMH